MSSLDKSDSSDRIAFKMFPYPLVEREKRRLHCLHEKPVVMARCFEDLFKLANIQRRRLLAHHMLAARKSSQANLSVCIRMRRNIDSIDLGADKLVERDANLRNFKLSRKLRCLFRRAAPDGREHSA